MNNIPKLEIKEDITFNNFINRVNSNTWTNRIYWDTSSRKFKNIDINWKLTISNNNRDLSFTDCNIWNLVIDNNIGWNLVIENCDIWNLIIKNSIFKNEVKLIDCDFTNNCIDCDTTINDNEIITSEDKCNLMIYNSTFKNKFSLLNLHNASCKILNSSFEKRFKFSYNDNWNISGKDSYLINNNFIFLSNTIKDFRFWLTEIKWLFYIDNIKLWSDNEINIWDVRINKFSMSNIRNLWKIRIYKFTSLKEDNKNSFFQINNSSLWDSEFQSIDISSFKKFIFYDNLVSGLKYTWVNFLINIEVEDYTNYYRKTKERNLLPEEKALKERNSYRVLKNLANDNNDKIVSNLFLWKELEAYLGQLKLNKTDYQKQVILSINKFISNFGNNWFKSFLWFIWFIFVSTILVIIYMYFIKNICITSISYFIKLFLELLLWPFYLLKIESIKNINTVWLLPLFWLVIYIFTYSILAWHLLVSIKKVVQK